MLLLYTITIGVLSIGFYITDRKHCDYVCTFHIFQRALYCWTENDNSIQTHLNSVT